MSTINLLPIIFNDPLASECLTHIHGTKTMNRDSWERKKKFSLLFFNQEVFSLTLSFFFWKRVLKFAEYYSIWVNLKGLRVLGNISTKLTQDQKFSTIAIFLTLNCFGYIVFFMDHLRGPLMSIVKEHMRIDFFGILSKEYWEQGESDDKIITQLTENCHMIELKIKYLRWWWINIMMKFQKSSCSQ